MVIRVSDKKKNYSKVTKLLVKPKFYQKISEEEVQSIYDQFLNSYKKEFK